MNFGGTKRQLFSGGVFGGAENPTPRIGFSFVYESVGKVLFLCFDAGQLWERCYFCVSTRGNCGKGVIFVFRNGANVGKVLIHLFL